jgi:hypothetical protein
MFKFLFFALVLFYLADETIAMVEPSGCYYRCYWCLCGSNAVFENIPA